MPNLKMLRPSSILQQRKINPWSDIEKMLRQGEKVSDLSNEELLDLSSRSDELPRFFASMICHEIESRLRNGPR